MVSGYTAHPVDPPGGDYRQLRAVYKYWAGLTCIWVFFYSPCTWQSLVLFWFLPEECSYAVFLGVDFWRYSVFSAYWFDSGHMVLPVYGGFCLYFLFSTWFFGAALVSTTAVFFAGVVDALRAMFPSVFSGPDVLHHGRYEPEERDRRVGLVA